jgi:hypothetical protein
MRARFCILIVAALCVQLAASAGPPPHQLILQWDNDVLAGTDRGYTNGVRLAVLREYQPGAEARGEVRRKLRRISEAIGDSSVGGLADSKATDLHFAFGTGITQLMFTPEDPEAGDTADGERPYAGWLGLELSAHLKDASSVSSVTVSIGTTGEASFAEDVQTWVHEEITGSPVFQGWDSQVPSEPTLNLHFDQKRRIGPRGEGEGWKIDGFLEWGGALGNYQTNAYLGAQLRGGLNLPATSPSPRLQLGSYGHDFKGREEGKRARLSAYALLGLRGTVVAHDITLDGPVFRDFDTGTRSEPLVGELLWGFGLGYGRASLTLSQALRTDEFAGQDEAQQFGSVQLRLGGRF